MFDLCFLFNCKKRLADWSPKPFTQVPKSAPKGNLLEAWATHLQTLSPGCMVDDSDGCKAGLPRVLRRLVWERPTSPPLPKVTVQNPKGKVPKTSFSFVEASH